MERLLLQGRGLGSRLSHQLILFPLLGGPSAYRWKVSPECFFFCSQVHSKYSLSYPNRFPVGPIPASSISGARLGKLSLGLTAYFLVLLSWVKDGPDGPNLPLQIHCLKFPVPSNLELVLFKPDLISRINSSIPEPQNPTFCSEKIQRINLAILDTWSQTDLRLILNAAT